MATKYKHYRVIIDFKSPFKYGDREIEFMYDYFEEFTNSEETVLGIKLVDPLTGETITTKLNTNLIQPKKTKKKAKK